jgi:Secretion system C-terminal sorting domain
MMKRLLFYMVLGAATMSSIAQSPQQKAGYLKVYRISKIAPPMNSNTVKPSSVNDSSTCYPPTNLHDSITPSGPYSADVSLSWNAPQHQPFSLYWDNGVNDGSIGFADTGIYIVAQRFTPADLAIYNGDTLTAILIHPNDTGTQYISIFKGANAGTIVLQQPITPIIRQWNEITLSTPIPIDTTQELWIGYTFRQVPSNPFQHAVPGCDSGPSYQGFGDMFSHDSGVTWTSLTSWGIPINWNIHGVVNNYNPKTLLSFSIFRNGTVLQSSLVGTGCTDYSVPQGVYKYYATSIYSDTCSNSSDTIIVEVLTGIAEHNVSGCKIYPNPANEIINIDVPGNIVKGRLINIFGSTVYSFDIDKNKTISINTSDLSEGCYFIQLTAKDGSAINKKVIITK